MSEVNILHLSDLHISSKNMSTTNRKLIQDIVNQTNNMNNIVIVVSGDVVDKGEYSKYKEGVLLFFRTIKEGIGKKIKEVYFVPGNHDKERNEAVKLYGQLCQKECIEITEDKWSLQKTNYETYLEMVTEVRKIFKLQTKKATDTFGVEICEIEENQICFVRFDTTWGTYGASNEEGKLILGKYQLDSLLKQYENLKNQLEEKGKHISLTIGVGHHPISWLCPEQEKIVKKYMIDEEYFNMNLYMCGHIHDMELENWYNSEHSLMTLVTGIGWNHHKENSGEKDKKDEHRYSIYVIDIAKNSCDIIMRRSQKNGKFICDYSVYVDDDREMEKLCYPLKIENSNQPFINMNSPKGDFVRSIFVDSDLMEAIQNVHSSMIIFQKKVVELLMFYKRDFIEQQADVYTDQEYQDAVSRLNACFFKGDDSDSFVKNIFRDNVEVVYEILTAFLQDALANFVDVFQNCFPKDSNLRVHFRWYDNRDDKDKYQKLCQYSNIDLEEGPSVSEIGWGGLIEQSYIIKKSLIYSVNSRYNNHEPVRWNDFMTVVPSFFKSDKEFRDSRGRKKKRPIITFGVSVINEQCEKDELSKVLYVLEYLDIFQLITNMLDDFVKDFDVDYNEYLSYIEHRRNK